MSIENKQKQWFSTITIFLSESPNCQYEYQLIPNQTDVCGGNGINKCSREQKEKYHFCWHTLQQPASIFVMRQRRMQAVDRHAKLWTN